MFVFGQNVYVAQRLKSNSQSMFFEAHLCRSNVSLVRMWDELHFCAPWNVAVCSIKRECALFLYARINRNYLNLKTHYNYKYLESTQMA